MIFESAAVQEATNKLGVRLGETRPDHTVPPIHTVMISQRLRLGLAVRSARHHVSTQ